ncbi:MAG: hypothetical protein HDR14_14145 [Lachnospiraceae bacterium]|nr:hypothetical protein [Lachnospiraceae bacterium]
MDRIKQLEQVVGKFLFERFSQSKEKIVSSYRANKEEIWKGFFDVVCYGAEECEKKNKKVKHIIISILYSSIITQSYELQIAYMNDDLHVDEAPVNVYWAPMFIFQFIEDDIQFFKKKASEEVPRIKEYEMDDIRKKYVLNHLFLVMLLLKEMLPAAIEEIINKYDCIADNIMVSIGRYMEKVVLLYQIGEESEIFFNRDKS